MSEVLAKLEKKGGDTLLPTTPDALYRNNNMGNNGTATLVVTKKPRWIIASYVHTTQTNSYFVSVIDVENGTAYRYGYFDGANHDETWSNWQNYFPSITDTAISIKNAYGNTCGVRVGAYY